MIVLFVEVMLGNVTWFTEQKNYVMFRSKAARTGIQNLVTFQNKRPSAG